MRLGTTIFSIDDIDADVSTLLERLGAIGGGLMILLGLLSWLVSRNVVGFAVLPVASLTQLPLAAELLTLDKAPLVVDSMP